MYDRATLCGTSAQGWVLADAQLKDIHTLLWLGYKATKLHACRLETADHALQKVSERPNALSDSISYKWRTNYIV